MYKPTLKMLNVEPVGNYAIRIDWSDGHNTGIYSVRPFPRDLPLPHLRPVGRTPSSARAPPGRALTHIPSIQAPRNSRKIVISYRPVTNRRANSLARTSPKGCSVTFNCPQVEWSPAFVNLHDRSPVPPSR